MHMTSEWKGFKEVSGYVKNLERVTQAGQTKIFTEKSNNVWNFNDSFSKGLSQ